MSDTAHRQLRVLVERVVRPLPLTLATQRRLRTELLAHLEAIYDEERQRAGSAAGQDSAAALARTAERFGDPAEISEEMLATISMAERISARHERFFAQQPTETVAGYALRLMMLVFLGILPLISLTVLMKHRFDVSAIPVIEYRLVGAFSLALPMYVGAYLLLSLSWASAWVVSPRRYVMLAICFISMASLWPLCLMLLMQIAGGSWSHVQNPKLSNVTLFVAGSLFTLALGAFTGLAHRRDTTYRHAWSTLEIE